MMCQLRNKITGKTQKRGALILFFLLAIGLTAMAIDDNPRVGVFEGKLGEIIPNAEREVIDEVYYSSLQSTLDNPANDVYRNIISLFINEDDRDDFIPSDFTATITVEITWTDKNENEQGPITKDLEISYKVGQGTKYNARNYYYFDNARKVKVKITVVNVHGATWDVTKVLRLENRMEVKRDYKFPIDISAIGVHSDVPVVDPHNPDELIVEWGPQFNVGITHYDIEWTWVDADDLDRYETDGDFDASLIFKNNSTRVTISAKDTSYSIPMIYDGIGYIFYRVRPVQYREDGMVVAGNWSSDPTVAGITFYQFNGHEPDLNWQVTTSYAEDGKRKTVIEYFDGTLRSRQTVTKVRDDNPEKNYTIVGETLYDFQGRPAINILPAPTLNKVIEYAKNFNQFDQPGDPKEVYDLVPVGQTICTATTLGLLNTSGASQYYSPNNTEVTEGIHKYIPDAQNYPYTETLYEPDATGRIAAQGGVGPDYQLNSGHETKYFYGGADQRVLDALFGTEAGNSSHYFKNMIRDANGQYSVSYIDMHGRTVATALAGLPPSNVETLPSYPEELPMATQDLLPKGSNILKGRSLESSTTLVVSKAGPHLFHYELHPQSAEITACNPEGQPVCYDCYYDLEIRITGNCGEEPIVITRKNFSFGSYDVDCENDPSPLVVEETYNLDEGEYNITKKLTLSKDAQDWYRENVFAEKNICKTLQQFNDENYDILLSTNNCDINCESCTAELGTEEEYRANFLISQGIDPNTVVAYEQDIENSYKEAKANCDALCHTTDDNLLTQIRDQMLEDVTPNLGQYALTDRDLDGDGVLSGSVTDDYGNTRSEFATDYQYNIFHNYKSPGSPFRNPKDESGGNGFYPDDAGARDESIYTTQPNGLPLLQSVNPDQFTDLFGKNWAGSLIYYHPEFKKLQFAEQHLKESYDWDKTLENTETWQAAEAAGFMDDITAHDPFFTGEGFVYRAGMEVWINVDYQRGKSMWELAWISVNCLNNSPTCGNGIPKRPPFAMNDCTGDWDRVWIAFRTLYQATKEIMVNDLLEQNCPGINYDIIKERRFGNFLNYDEDRTIQSLLDIVNNNNNTAQQAAQQAKDLMKPKLDQQYAANCDGYIEAWKAKLLQCDQLASISDPEKTQILNEIVQGMKDVCFRGSDQDHPNGSSTVPPGDTRSPQSFEEVIASVFNNHDIEISALCNPYMIDFPQAYDKQPPISDAVVLKQKDDCVCQRIKDLQAEQAQTGFIGTLSEFIKYQHGVDVSQELIDQLISGCNGTCNLYETPLSVPAILTCHSPLKNCIECAEYDALKQEFLSTYPTFTIIHATPETDDEMNENVLFQNFMNHRTGFSKSWDEYLQFEIACQNYVGTSPWTCSGLKSIVTTFYQTYDPTSYGIDCQEAFTSFFNQASGTSYTFSQIQALFKQYCGSAPDVCQPELSCQGLEDIITAFHSQYGNNVDEAPDCQSLFVDYFNDHFGTNYSWDELNNLSQSLCGKPLDVCTGHTCQELQQILDNWHNCHELTWTEGDCTDQWTLYFNSQANSNFDYLQIDSLYKVCGLTMDPCKPPVECETLNQILNSYYNKAINLKQGLVAYYPFNGDDKDHSGNHNDPVFDNATPTTDRDGNANGAYLFDGSSSYMQVPHSSSLNTSSITLVAQFKPNGFYTGPCHGNEILCKGTPDYENGVYVMRFADFAPTCNTPVDTTRERVVGATSGAGVLAETPLITTGQWYNVIYTYDGTVSKIYVNGQLENSSNLLATTAPNSNDLFIGRNENVIQFPYWFNGVIDEIRIYNRALSEEEALALPNYYSQGSGSVSQSCNDDFTAYINNKLGTHYSYEQIALMYKNICGTELSTCGSKFDCNSLTSFAKGFTAWYKTHSEEGSCEDLFTEQFNQNFDADYTYDQAVATYVLYCGQKPGLCAQPLILTCQQLENVLGQFRSKYPNPVDYFSGQCQQAFADYFNQAFGTSFPYNIVVKYYSSLCDISLDVCNENSCESLQSFLDNYNIRYESYSMPQLLCHDLFTRLYNNQFNPNSNVRNTWTDIVRIYAHCGINLDICPADNNQLLDCNRVEGARQAFFGFYSGALPGNCEQVFTQFFNTYFNTSFTDYSQLQMWVAQNCNTTLVVCGNQTLNRTMHLRTTAELPQESLPPRLCGADPTFPTVEEDGTPCDFLAEMAANLGHQQYDAYVRIQKDQFDQTYQDKCLSAIPQEIFRVESEIPEYHYTLYYYDQAGNLVKTVPPEGVDLSHMNNEEWYQDVEDDKATDGYRPVIHSMVTQYRYNSLNQVVAQISPDGGESHFWYDLVGRLVVSQNAKQADDGKYSYTKYDELGRITEVGQLSADVMSQEVTQNADNLNSWFEAADNTREQITVTVYDRLPNADLNEFDVCGLGVCQQNLRNRVSFSKVFNHAGDDYATATYYSYDIHGNVDFLLQHYQTGILSQIGENGFKRIFYKYDLVSGKVNEVAYQPGFFDQFFHRYEYDAENKLTDVSTSHDYVYWEKQAHYEYYRHGPLARVELGQLAVQGVDYAYTLQGWLKGVNSTFLGDAFDPGGDGAISPTIRTPKDVYGFALHYNDVDYHPIHTDVHPFADVVNGLPILDGDGIETGKNLFNGNIRAMMVNIPQLGEAKLYGYRYDQLNRIKAMNEYGGLNAEENTFDPAVTADHSERISYDANGNIMTYHRNGAADVNGLSMDDLTYHYYDHTNRLSHVNDAATSSYTEDIKDQDDENYDYDEIGNLIKDNSEGITNIDWTVYGKIASITKDGATIEYTYDASGNRIGKSVTADGITKNSWYVRDAVGNVICIYENNNGTINDGHLTQSEIDLYGSSRLGIWNANRDMENPIYSDAMPGTTDGIYMVNWTRGITSYELSNHLGNVLVTVSDRKYQVDANEDGTVAYYNADIVTANDYYPFGMIMPGRQFSTDGYRYGFNGKEKDDEVKGEGNSLDFGTRIYDPRIGRWLSVDPLQKKYPSLTPYHYCLENPILFIDPNGKEVIIKDKDNNTVATVKADGKIIAVKGYENSEAIHSYSEARDYLARGKSSSFSTLEKDKKITIFQLTDQQVAGGAKFIPTGKISFTDANHNGIYDAGETVTDYKPDSKENGTILWNPRTGALDAEGNYHSPALLVDHETKHGVRHLTDGKKMIMEAVADPTHAVEENRAIGEVNKVSKELNNNDGGNGGRKTHGGSAIDQPCVTCHYTKQELEALENLRKQIQKDKMPKIDNTANGNHSNGNGGGY